MITPFPASSHRLTYSPVTKEEFPELLDLYNSNPDFMEYSFGKRTVTMQAVEDDHGENESFEGSYSFAFRERNHSAIIGIGQFILCNPRDGQPWLGLIMLHSSYQGKGYAQEFLDTLIGWYKENGFASLHLAVIEKNKAVVPFYEKYGFVTYEVRDSEKLGRVICMSYAIK